ncbi:MAG: hypothetical protein M1453_04920, partial [Acidobacteria bacterium]|nr:hypothetical protein [Acidobacteriota bacterium]
NFRDIGFIQFAADAVGLIENFHLNGFHRARSPVGGNIIQWCVTHGEKDGKLWNRSPVSGPMQFIGPPDS